MAEDVELHPLPSRITTLRPHQSEAIDQIVAAFDTHDVVMVEGPTGVGKTVIGHQVANRMDARALYVCSGKDLQDQFSRDFEEVGARVIKGRANYPTERRPALTAEDCTSTGPRDPCLHCRSHATCPYQVAKRDALEADLAVLNTSYLLTTNNYTNEFVGRDLVVADEADTLESNLLGFIELRVTDSFMRRLHLNAPVKGTHKPRLIEWLTEAITEVRTLARGTSDPRTRRRYTARAAEFATVAKELAHDVATADEDEDSGRWLRDYDQRGTLILKPVSVARYGNKYLWRHHRKWLLMSATIISGDEIAQSLGITKPWTALSIPSTFPPENRPIVLAPIANVTYKTKHEAQPKLAYAVDRIMDRHPNDRILVHAVSYELASYLHHHVNHYARGVITYTRAQDRAAALQAYLETEASVLIAPSMERGIDLPDDLCRVQVVCKCPFPSLGDRQVSARTHLPGGQLWYSVQTIRDVVQMTGRAVRHDTDHAITYVLDQQFSNLYRKTKPLFPQWWRDAVDNQVDIRDLMTPTRRASA